MQSWPVQERSADMWDGVSTCITLMIVNTKILKSNTPFCFINLHKYICRVIEKVSSPEWWNVTGRGKVLFCGISRTPLCLYKSHSLVGRPKYCTLRRPLISWKPCCWRRSCRSTYRPHCNCILTLSRQHFVRWKTSHFEWKQVWCPLLAPLPSQCQYRCPVFFSDKVVKSRCIIYACEPARTASVWLREKYNLFSS